MCWGAGQFDERSSGLVSYHPVDQDPVVGRRLGHERRDDFIASIINFNNEKQMTRTLRLKMRNEFLANPEFTFERVNRVRSTRIGFRRSRLPGLHSYPTLSTALAARIPADTNVSARSCASHVVLARHAEWDHAGRIGPNVTIGPDVVVGDGVRLQRRARRQR